MSIIYTDSEKINSFLSQNFFYYSWPDVMKTCNYTKNRSMKMQEKYLFINDYCKPNIKWTIVCKYSHTYKNNILNCAYTGYWQSLFFFAYNWIIPNLVVKLEMITLRMVLNLDGNSEIGAHVRSNLCYLICFIESSHKLNSFFPRKDLIFLHTCVTFSELPSNIKTVTIRESAIKVAGYCFTSGKNALIS